MCGCHDPRRLLGLADLRQGYVEFHSEAETTLRGDGPPARAFLATAGTGTMAW